MRLIVLIIFLRPRINSLAKRLGAEEAIEFVDLGGEILQGAGVVDYAPGTEGAVGVF
jgi:hypothetical protein